MSRGRAAYEKWRELHAHPTQPWEKLSKATKAVWEEVAKAAVGEAMKKQMGKAER